MGRLLHKASFTKDAAGDPSWWFPSSFYGGYGNRNGYQYDLAEAFPHQHPIHQKFVGDLDTYSAKATQQKLRVEIRKFVERKCEGNAVYTHDKMDYDYLYERNNPRWSHEKYGRVRIKHGYMNFHFEEETDWLMFRIAFGQYIRPTSNRHPDYLDVDEAMIELAKDHFANHEAPAWTQD
jgi:hypothetical protein